MVHQCSDLNDLNAQLEAAGGKLVVIDFFATWCGPCKMIAPKIVEMDAEMNNVVFLKVDVDEAEDAAQEYNIQAMPTFLFIKNKQKVCTLVPYNILVNKYLKSIFIRKYIKTWVEAKNWPELPPVSARLIQ